MCDSVRYKRATSIAVFDTSPRHVPLESDPDATGDVGEGSRKYAENGTSPKTRAIL